MRFADGKHSGCQQIGSFQTTFYFSTWRLRWKCFPSIYAFSSLPVPYRSQAQKPGRWGGGLGVRFEGIVTLLWEVFGIKNDIISYNISSSPIDHYKKTVAIPLLDSSIIQMQHRFSDEDCHARHLLRLVQSILINKALQLGRMKLKAYCSGGKTFHFSNLLEMRLVDGKHSGCQQIGSFQTTFYFSTWRLQWKCFPNIYAFSSLPVPYRSQAQKLSVFSLMKRIKTCSRSTVERLSDLAVHDHHAMH